MTGSGAWIVGMAAVGSIAAVGCKKKGASPPAAEEAAPAAPAVELEMSREIRPLASLTAAAGATKFVPAPLVEGVAPDGLGIKFSHPGNVAVEVDGSTAVLTADGFYPVRISTEPLTIDNAELTIDVGGAKRPAPGSKWDGRAKVIQTDCLLIRCEVMTPDGAYLTDVADAGRAICASIEPLPPRTEGYVRGYRNGSMSWSGACNDEDKAVGDRYGEMLSAQEVRDAVETCWREATAANEAWAPVRPTFRATWRLPSAGGDAFSTEVRGLEGDTAALEECLDEAVAPVAGALPDVTLSAGCATATFVGVYELDHRPVCEKQ